jgi:hypothetical protein
MSISQETSPTSVTMCDYRTYHDGTYDQRHSFRVATTSDGAILYCTQCGITFLIGDDQRWHMTGYGAGIDELQEDETE